MTNEILCYVLDAGTEKRMKMKKLIKVCSLINNKTMLTNVPWLYRMEH
jgi:hypothetical protein